MINKSSHLFREPDPKNERRRRKRELVLIPCVLAIVGLLTFLETRLIKFGADIPVSNTILMFILININLLLLVLLIFLVFRNLVKLLYDRRRNAVGANLRTRLVVAFVALTLLPTTILFFFSISFISTSIEFWFNVPVEQALQKSLNVGRRVYDRIENNNQFFLERVAYQIDANKLFQEKKYKALSRYIKVVQREFHIDAVEVYDRELQRLTFALAPRLENETLPTIATEVFGKDDAFKKVKTVTEFSQTGERVRTVATVPFGVKSHEADGFVVLSILVPPALANDMQAISHGFEEYQQIKLLKKPIQITYYISLSIVALLVVFCAVWFGFYLAKSITIPIMELAEGTRRVADGDLEVQLDLSASDEIGILVNAFNKMTRDLRTGRDQLELSADMLSQRNIEIEARRQYMEIVLKNVSAGVISLDSRGVFSTMNTSAERMLNLNADDIIDRNYAELLQGHYLELAGEVLQELNSAKNDTVEFPIRLNVHGRPRSFLVNFNALKDDAGYHMGVVMVFDDLTELEKAQRMAAWREVARRIAHEVKNPLTPISLSAQRLKRKYANQIDDPVFDECTRMIIDHVDLIRNLVNEFSAFARFPTADLAACHLPPIIEETVALYKEGHEHIQFETKIEGDLPIPQMNLDRQQIKQAMINLVDNAIAAVKGRGKVEIKLAYFHSWDRLRVEVSDNGPGITDSDKARLFEPNFSTKKAGTGLGLTIVNTIVADHQGTISVEDRKPRGARFVIELPVQPASENAVA
jgi:two-component system, NtrC family, nitrogen regulation sensor histidine kinase NtrY